MLLGNGRYLMLQGTSALWSSFNVGSNARKTDHALKLPYCVFYGCVHVQSLPIAGIIYRKDTLYIHVQL